MKVFKTIAAIIWQKKITILIYLFTPILLTVLFTPLLADSTTGFEEDAVRFAVRNEDLSSPLAARLVEVLEAEHERVALPEDPQELDNALFYGDIEYLLEIPDGFFTAHTTEDPGTLPQLRHTRTPALEGGSANLELLITRYLQTLELERAADPTLSEDELVTRLNDEDLLFANTVEMHVSSRIWTSTLHFYHRFVAFGLISSIFYLVALVSLAMNSPQVLPRQLVSPVSRGRINGGTTLTMVFFSFLVVLIYLGIGLLMFGEALLSAQGLLAFLNMLAFGYVSLAISLFISHFAKNDQAISVIGNIVPLSFAFFGGIFVPINFMAEPVQKLAPFIPTYWYTRTLDALQVQGTANEAVWTEALTNLGILLIYGTVFLLLSFAVAYASGKRSAKSIRTKARYG